MRIDTLLKLTNEKWLNLWAATWEHQGHRGRWVFASRREKPHTGHRNDAVLIVPVLRNPGEPPRLVLIREFRVPVGDYVIGLPAGLIEEGETIESAIAREMREETGYELAKVKRVSAPLCSSSGLTDEAAAMAFVDVTGGPDAKPAPEASEEIEVLVLDQAGINRVCDDTSLIVDAKAWAVLYMYQQLGKVE